MGSNQHGEFCLGRGRSSGSSTRRNKKIGSEKPKLPQRGLGVAQLEKIRIQSQLMAGYNLHSANHPFHSSLTMEDMRLPLSFPPTSSPSSSHSSASSSVYSVNHPNFMTGNGENLSTDIRFSSYQEMTSIPQLDHFQPVALPLMQDSVQERIQYEHGYFGRSFSDISDSSESQELDLELRLSL